MGCSLINHPFGCTSIYGNPHIYIYTYLRIIHDIYVENWESQLKKENHHVILQNQPWISKKMGHVQWPNVLIKIIRPICSMVLEYLPRFGWFSSGRSRSIGQYSSIMEHLGEASHPGWRAAPPAAWRVPLAASEPSQGSSGGPLHERPWRKPWENIGKPWENDGKP